MKKSGAIKKQILLIIILSILIPPVVLIIVSAIRFQKFSIEQAQNNMEKAANEIDALNGKSFSIAKKSSELLKKTVHLVQEIANSGIEQKAGTEQINKVIQQLNTVTQDNAESAEFLAANVEALNTLAKKLNQDIKFF